MPYSRLKPPLPICVLIIVAIPIDSGSESGMTGNDPACETWSKNHPEAKVILILK